MVESAAVTHATVIVASVIANDVAADLPAVSLLPSAGKPHQSYSLLVSLRTGTAGMFRWLNRQQVVWVVGALAAALGMSAAAWQLVPDDLFWPTVLYGWALLALAITDLRLRLLPNELTALVAVGGAGTAAVSSELDLAASAIGIVTGYATLALAGALFRLVRRRDGLGGGDPKLFGAIGAWVGPFSLPSVLLVGALTALAWHVLKRDRTQRTAEIPFGAFLAIAGWLVWVFGPLQFGTGP